MTTRTRNQRLTSSKEHPKIVTLQDVAGVAGVTSMTVSRVIKGQGGVGAATRERVLRIAEELNYTANLSARALATGKTGVIAIISAGLNRPYYANIVHLLESHIVSSGYQMRLLHTHDDLRDLINSTKASVVDGVIIAGEYDLAHKFRSLAPQVFESCVFIDAVRHPDTDHVHCDLVPPVEEALGLMRSAGRARLAYIGHLQTALPATTPEGTTPPSLVESEERMRIYLSFMERSGLSPELIGGRPQFSLSPAALSQYFKTHGCPGGLLCVNDETAMYTYRALRDAGFATPDDALLVGCDDLPFMGCFDPPLSTIKQPLTEICALAWKFLQTRMALPHLPSQQMTFDAKLVVRQSLQPPAPPAPTST